MNTGRRLLVGAIAGTLTGGVFAIWAAVLWNANQAAPRLVERVSLEGIAVFYLSWGCITGLGVGLLYPWARTAVGSVVVGAGVMVGAYVPAGLMLDESAATVVFVTAVGAVVGGVAGRKVLGPGSRYIGGRPGKE